MNIKQLIEKYRVILSKQQRIRLFKLGILMICSAFLEMLSVSLILPFMKAAMEPDEVLRNKYVSWICKLLSIDSGKKFLIFIAIVLACVYVLKNIFMIYQTTVQCEFVYNNMYLTQKKLLNRYFSQRYDFFLGAKSGEILRVIEQDTVQAFLLLSTLLQIMSESVVSFVLAITIFIISPQITVEMTVILVLLLFIIGKVIKPIMNKAGVEYRDANTKMNQWLIQSVSGIKEIKILDKESFFEGQFSVYGKIFVDTRKNFQRISMIPRYMVEAFSLSSLMIIVAIMIARTDDMSFVLPVLSGIAMAAIRLLPSVYRISQGMASISFDFPSLNALEKVILEEDVDGVQVDQAKVVEETINQLKIKDFSSLAMDNVSYRYPSGDRNVLNNVSFEIKKGMSVGIVGSSGGGKTTTADLLLGLLSPVEGEIYIDNYKLSSVINEWHSMIGYIPQQIFILDGNVRDNIAFGIPPEEVGEEKIWTVLKDAALDEFVKELPEGLDTELGERGIRLSGGQRQRIGIARALYKSPSVLFFDEATSALDGKTESEIMESIRALKGKITMVIIAHRLSTIEHCDHVYRVEDGNIIKEK
jgi:hypothetical protein